VHHPLGSTDGRAPAGSAKPGAASSSCGADSADAHADDRRIADTPASCSQGGDLDSELRVTIDKTFDPDRGRRTTGFTDLWLRVRRVQRSTVSSASIASRLRETSWGRKGPLPGVVRDTQDSGAGCSSARPAQRSGSACMQRSASAAEPLASADDSASAQRTQRASGQGCGESAPASACALAALGAYVDTQARAWRPAKLTMDMGCAVTACPASVMEHACKQSDVRSTGSLEPGIGASWPEGAAGAGHAPAAQGTLAAGFGVPMTTQRRKTRSCWLPHCLQRKHLEQDLDDRPKYKRKSTDKAAMDASLGTTQRAGRLGRRCIAAWACLGMYANE
jgi:hypothetical protein